MSAKISLVCRRRLTPSPLIRRATRSCTESSHSTWQTCGAGKDKGEHFKVGPAVNYLNSLAKQLSDKHKHVNDKTKYFFTCKDVNGSSDPWVWFNGVRSNVHVIIYERAAKRGEQIDAYAPAIYPTHVDKISEALIKEGSDHSATVNITQLTTMLIIP